MNTEQWSTRRVDAMLQIQFAGQNWSVHHMPSVHVGDQVQCLPAHQGGALRIRGANAAQRDTWALLTGPARSYPHTCPQTGTLVNSGNATNARAPQRQYSAEGASRTPQTPPGASPQAHKHNHKRGTAGAAPGAPASPIVLVLHVYLPPRRGRKGSGKQRHSSWSNSKKVR